MIDAADSLSHRTMLMVLYSTGMRNAELRHLQVADIDSRRMLIHIQRGKGGRDRYVPLSPTLLDDAARVLPLDAAEDVAVSRARSHGWRADKPITPKVLWEACVVAARRAGLRKRVLAAPAAPFLCDAPARERAPTCGRFSCCSGTWRSGTRCSISISRRSICRPSPIRWMRCTSRRPTPRAAIPAEAPAVTRPPFEVADIVRRHGDRFLETHRAWVTRAASARPPGHRAVPHGGARRASRSL